MRIVIIGQKWLAEQLLQQCLADNHKVVAVVAPNTSDRLFQAACKCGVLAFDALPNAEMLPQSDVILWLMPMCLSAKHTAKRRN